MNVAVATEWAEAPEVGIPEPPALFSDTRDLWLAYEVAPSSSNRYAIVKFGQVIDHRLWPINDEGIGKHPYATAGLKFYSFHEIYQSREVLMWAALNARHWVVTFKDNTLDVVAENVAIVATDLPGEDAASVLIEALRRKNG